MNNDVLGASSKNNNHGVRSSTVITVYETDVSQVASVARGDRGEGRAEGSAREACPQLQYQTPVRGGGVR